METQTVAFTHKGFFGFCPILLSELDNPAPMIEPRWRFLDPLLVLNEIIAGVLISFKSKVDPEWEPVFPVWKVKQMRKPVYRDFEIYE